jgi:hypothetical protein
VAVALKKYIVFDFTLPVFVRTELFGKIVCGPTLSTVNSVPVSLDSKPGLCSKRTSSNRLRQIVVLFSAGETVKQLYIYIYK